MKKIILASNSPRRKELLEKYGIEFSVTVSKADENIKEYNSASDFAVKASLAKAEAVLNKIKANKDFLKNDYIIIAADTVVTLNNIIYGKPKNKDDAFKILSELSGKTHYVITGVTIIKNIKKENNLKTYTFFDKTEIKFKNISFKEIDEYIKTGEPFDKAGAYAIQGKAAKFVESINGDFENVVGLPVYKVLKFL